MKTMNDTKSGRSVVLNDDILCLILNELPVKQLARLETVSQQFMDCVANALKSRSALTVGQEFGDAFERQEWYYKEVLHDLVKSHQTFGSILRKCSNITTIYLNNCYIDFNTIALIMNLCSHLKRLSFNWIHLSANQDMEEWERTTCLLSRLDVIELRIDVWFEVNFNYSVGSLCAEDLLEQLSLIKKLHTNYYLKSLDNEWCADWRPKLYCSLRLKDLITVLELSAIEALIDGNKTIIQELVISRGIDLNENNDIFRVICDKLNLKTLGFSATPASDFEESVFVDNIVKQTSLEKLSIGSNITFNTISLKPMPTLRSLTLNRIDFEPQMWSNCADVFPNLRHLTLNDIHMRCVCVQQYMFGIGCDRCVHSFMSCLSRLDQLTHLCIEDRDMETMITDDNLKMFTELQVLDLSSFDLSDNLIDNLYKFCCHLFDNRVPNKWFRLLVSPDVRQQLCLHYNDNNVLIPKYLILGIKPS